MMDKRQGMMGALVAVVVIGCAGAWWFMQQGSEPAADVTPPARVAPKPVVKAPAPAAAAAAPAAKAAKPVTPGHAEPDALALSEEEIDRVNQEKDDLAARAADLQSQVEDGTMIVDMKAKQIKELEAQLKAAKGKPAKK